MRALLTPEIARGLGVVLFKPGRDLLGLFSQGRVLVEVQPESMARLPSGRVPDVRQPLAEDEALIPFFTDERVINAAGGLAGLEHWLKRNVKACQYPHSEYHHHELVAMRHPPGAIMLCWHCENQLREQTTAQLTALATSNVVAWVTDTVLGSLRYNRDRELSIAELCWWAVSAGIADAITEDMATRALRLPSEPFQSVYKESDIVPSVPATSILHKKLNTGDVPIAQRHAHTEMQHKNILTLQVDPESPESFMLRPKRRRWINEKYTRWVKTQPCACCGCQADDPHHLIGHGQGGMGTKAHDLFVLPLCRKHHDELHRDPVAFEEKYGSQPELILRFIDRVLAIGVLA
ncbi:DUF968 domain-containing protein [Salmonella enterica]|nr:DUF968 domain-containing protein [Salmonella enterica]